MNKLTYDTPIRAAAWNDITFATVFTVAGYAAKNGQDAAAVTATAKVCGHALVGSIYTGGALVGDRALAASMNAKARATTAQAVTLASGDTVEIDGTLYEVRFNRGDEFGGAPRHSDPVAFRAV